MPDNSNYKIDVLAKFQAFAVAELIVLIECKRYSNAVERELVQVLHDKVRSVGAHEGMLFTATGFQSGEIKYAMAHGIALVSIIDGVATYETRSAYPVAAKPPTWLNLPKFALWHVGENDAGNITMKSFGRAGAEITDMFGD
ncbi:restriction endonuclease [Pseudomonas lurida]|uniref:restriction endonuclease n=1 Tax=Pseudomonas lurida TaxID=244566 RepID=UPI001656D9B7|nr:restriction endonuclease [Pseudomonas lurida]MBC8982418.1 restriction endonuclease [Pseudomonas lurida]